MIYIACTFSQMQSTHVFHVFEIWNSQTFPLVIYCGLNIEPHCFHVYVYQCWPQTLAAMCRTMGIWEVFMLLRITDWFAVSQRYLAPVPLSIFRSNSKFDENSEHSSVKFRQPITTIFCTRHDSVTVVTCAKYRCDRSSIFETRAFWIFVEFRIRSKYA